MNPVKFGTDRTINAKVIAISFFMARHQTSPPKSRFPFRRVADLLITFDHKVV